MSTVPHPSANALSFIHDPRDPQFQEWRQDTIKACSGLTEQALLKRLDLDMAHDAPPDDHQHMRKRQYEMHTTLNDMAPHSRVAKDILGTTTTSGLLSGSPYIRQDLEPLRA